MTEYDACIALWMNGNITEPEMNVLLEQIEEEYEKFGWADVKGETEEGTMDEAFDNVFTRQGENKMMEYGAFLRGENMNPIFTSKIIDSEYFGWK